MALATFNCEQSEKFYVGSNGLFSKHSENVFHLVVEESYGPDPEQENEYDDGHLKPKERQEI
jgi:hypothetical protein